MRDYTKFYIGGEWVDPASGATTADVINPATEAAAGKIAMGTAADVDAVFSLVRALDLSGHGLRDTDMLTLALAPALASWPLPPPPPAAFCAAARCAAAFWAATFSRCCFSNSRFFS